MFINHVILQRVIYTFIILCPMHSAWGFSLNADPRRPFEIRHKQKSPSLKTYEDSLAQLGKTMLAGPDEDSKRNATYKFIPLLVKALKLPGSFDYPFDSVKIMRITKSPDNKFRIFSWFINLNNVAYRFFGAIQLNNKDALTLYPLLDYSDHILKPEYTVTEAKKWYGSEYYDIFPADDRGYYLLLGWKGMTADTKARLVEVLHFENGKPVFGAPIFRNGKTVKSRLIFYHKTDVTMKLKFLREKNEIIMDHLGPGDSTLKGKYKNYGPDGSYDALVEEGGFWVLRENVTLLNEAPAK